MIVLGIETSCDETAAAVVEEGARIRSNVIASQYDLHERYGGVVPEIASRAHLERISPVVAEALETANIGFADLDAIAVGNRPGLIGSLLVGVNAAKAIAWATGKPLIGIDHVRSHLYAGTMGDQGTGDRAREPSKTSPDREGAGGRQEASITSPDRKGAGGSEAATASEVEAGEPGIYPALGLVVSGGHTSLYELVSPVEMTLLGRTIDDAVGEAYDKAAVILQLGYPGGPKLDRLAQTGDGSDYNLPRSMLGRDSLDFSFSGLKTALLYKVRGHPQGRGREATFARSADDLSETQRANLAAAFQEAAIDVLISKLGRAIDQLIERGCPPRSLLVGGGVSANSLLRNRVMELGAQRRLRVCLPAMSLCLDNAAMIAGLAYHYFTAAEFDDLTLEAQSTLRR